MTPVRDAISQALDVCDRETIHIPGSIQPHGFLLALDSHGRIAQASANAAGALGIDAAVLRGSDLGSVLGADHVALLEAIEALPVKSRPEYLRSIVAADSFTYQAIAHRQNGILVLEFERTPETAKTSPANIFSLVRDLMAFLTSAASIAQISFTAAREVRRLTNFDRVMIYRFDDEWNGTVIAEDRNEELPSYLDLRFPASDIPSQARELYRLNHLRIIPDAGYTAVPIEPTTHPETGRPLDLTYSVLRSVSPVHVQYMKNMGTGASMSISILREGALWGLVSCHSKLPRQVLFEVRSGCDMIAQMLSQQILAAEHRADADSRVALKSTQAKLLGYMTEEDNFIEALASHSTELLACTEAAGAAIVFDGQCHTFGLTPDEDSIRQFVTWVGQRVGEEATFATDSLGRVYEPAKKFSHLVSGAIAMSISALHDSYLLWFRPEVVQTVKWGGDPRKAVEPGSAGRLSPRNSFEVWKELVRGGSRPWSASEVDSAADLRHAIVRIVLRKAEELAQLSSELQRSNEELETFSYAVSHDLRAPFRHIVGFSELLRELDSANLSATGRRYLATIIESAHFAGNLVDNLLSFSQMGRAVLHYTRIDSLQLIEEVKVKALLDEPHRSIEWRIGSLPQIDGDLFMLRLVFQNLISNALKYSRPRAGAVVEIGASRRGKETVFTIRDNGVGFDQQYSGKLFGIFQRLHKIEDFEGTGIGLANVKRIVVRHGGLVWAEGTLDVGAAFSFSLPDSAEVSTSNG